MVSEFEAQVRATNEKINARTGRPLAMALTVGLALGLSLLFSLIFVKALYMVFAGVLVAFTAFELASALRFAGLNIPRLPTVIAGVAVVPASFYWLAEGQWYITLAGIAFVSVWRLVWLIQPKHRGSVRSVLKDLGAGVFVMLYVAFLASFTVLLTAQDGGQWWTLALLIVVVVSDIGAYASGLSFGKHPMAPTISPNKTWEGFAGAAVASVIAGVLLALFMIDQPVWVGIVFGLVILGTATMGDLAESLIKRDLGIKDISTWLPGHGGFLDRVDSSLLSAAAGYALFLIFA
ncbi:phosphatidate cytidylyltransferase [Salinibacterium sp. M195]|uniref:phosphatidate cytidylyltransferase n=1 Tax=Salinibacterium sp. M195 TaxID=2583374 RepID=UPI001C62AB13|nr:phosphatidate cytidylyltransferase [Salinibacterium sp. M195]QYH35772.1 phosphatidate cytidylyltransferase [Salinibacterium sp. M195]